MERPLRPSLAYGESPGRHYIRKHAIFQAGGCENSCLASTCTPNSPLCWLARGLSGLDNFPSPPPPPHQQPSSASAPKSLLGGAGLTCGKVQREGEGAGGQRLVGEQSQHAQRRHRGRLFLDPTAAVGEEARRRREAERQWTRWLDERRCLEDAGTKAEAAEEARISPKVGKLTG